MHGAQDRIVAAANAQRLADGIAGARLVVFPDAGHVYITDAAQAANQEVLHFLAGISGQPAAPAPARARQPTRWTRERMTDPLVRARSGAARGRAAGGASGSVRVGVSAAGSRHPRSGEAGADSARFKGGCGLLATSHSRMSVSA